MPWISAGASVLGGIMGLVGQNSANQAAMDRQLQNEDWQEHMSNTQMQRRVVDLKAAGLNPLLAVNSGGAAMGSVSQAPVGNSLGQLGAGISQAGIAFAQADNLRADAELKRANAETIRRDMGDRPLAMPTKEDGSPDWDAIVNNNPSKGNLDRAAAAANLANLRGNYELIQKQVENYGVEIEQGRLDNELKRIGQDQARQLLPLVIRKAAADAGISEAELSDAKQMQKLMNSDWGPWIKGLQTVIGAVAPMLGPLGNLLKPAPTIIKR